MQPENEPMVVKDERKLNRKRKSEFADKLPYKKCKKKNTHLSHYSYLSKRTFTC